MSGALLRPGDTCWRVARAARVALLLDNQSYFAAVGAALRLAQRSVLIVGWQFDPRTPLSAAGAQAPQQDRIGDMLLELAAQRPSLAIRVLVWDMFLPLAAARELFPQRARAWFDGTRVDFRLDDRHPAGACHHQKLVIVDDALAFCSGADFAGNRWDSDLHLDEDPRRRLTSGGLQRPRHGVTVAVDGAAAAALAEVAQARWARATGEAIAPDPAPEAPWPQELAADLRDCEVGIARSLPAYSGQPEVREGEALYLAAIAAARRLIYLENQYFASPRIAEALQARLAERDGPEVLLILPRHSPGVVDRLTMDSPRHNLLERLQAADTHARFHVYAPYTAAGRAIVVHSKVTVIDDRLLRAGSANISNRSMGFDSECDLAIDAAGSGAGRRAIERFLQRLIAHYLHVPRADVIEALAREGSLAGAIEALRRPDANRLEPLRPHPLGPLRALVAAYHVGDPRSAQESFRPWRRNAG